MRERKELPPFANYSILTALTAIGPRFRGEGRRQIPSEPFRAERAPVRPLSFAKPVEKPVENCPHNCIRIRTGDAGVKQAVVRRHGIRTGRDAGVKQAVVRRHGIRMGRDASLRRTGLWARGG